MLVGVISCPGLLPGKVGNTDICKQLLESWVVHSVMVLANYWSHWSNHSLMATVIVLDVSLRSTFDKAKWAILLGYQKYQGYSWVFTHSDDACSLKVSNLVFDRCRSCLWKKVGWGANGFRTTCVNVYLCNSGSPQLVLDSLLCVSKKLFF